jgi:hypothetical protein
LAKYDMLFSVGGQAYEIESTWPNLVFDAVASGAKAPKTVAVLTSKFASVNFVTQGAREAMKKRGLTEAVYLEWEFGNRDFGSIAARIKDANPDFLWVGSIGPESIQLLEALSKIDYRPKLHFHLYPTPGPMSQSPLGANALSFTTFEQHARSHGVPLIQRVPKVRELPESFSELRELITSPNATNWSSSGATTSDNGGRNFAGSSGFFAPFFLAASSTATTFAGSSPTFFTLRFVPSSGAALRARAEGTTAAVGAVRCVTPLGGPSTTAGTVATGAASTFAGDRSASSRSHGTMSGSDTTAKVVLPLPAGMVAVIFTTFDVRIFLSVSRRMPMRTGTETVPAPPAGPATTRPATPTRMEICLLATVHSRAVSEMAN